MHLNEIAKYHYTWCEKMGWHNKSPLEYLALIASEVGEAVNECRGHTPTPELDEELADIILRVCDFALANGTDIEQACRRKLHKNRETGNRGRLK